MKGKFIKKLTAYALTAAMVVSTPMTAFASEFADNFWYSDGTEDKTEDGIGGPSGTGTVTSTNTDTGFLKDWADKIEGIKITPATAVLDLTSGDDKDKKTILTAEVTFKEGTKVPDEMLEQINAQIEWSTSDYSIVRPKVSAGKRTECEITGYKAGYATITAGLKTSGSEGLNKPYDYTAKCRVMVKKKAEDFNWNIEQGGELYAGHTYDLQDFIRFEPADAYEKVTFEIADDMGKIATFDKTNGILSIVEAKKLKAGKDEKEITIKASIEGQEPKEVKVKLAHGNPVKSLKFAYKGTEKKEKATYDIGKNKYSKTAPYDKLSIADIRKNNTSLEVTIAGEDKNSTSTTDDLVWTSSDSRIVRVTTTDDRNAENVKTDGRNKNNNRPADLGAGVQVPLNKVVFEGVSVGKADITVKSTNGKKATFKVTVTAGLVAVTKVEIDGSATWTGKTTPFIVTRVPAENKDKLTVKFATSDAGKAAKKVVKAKAGITPTITPAAELEKLKAPVTLQADGSVKLAKGDICVEYKKAGEKTKTTTPVEAFTVKQSDVKIQDNTVSGFSKADLKAAKKVSAISGKTYVCDVQLDPSHMKPGKDAVSWVSSKDSVATVEDGKIKVVGDGSAKITVSSVWLDGTKYKTAKAAFTVNATPKCEQIVLKANTVTVQKGKKANVQISQELPKKANDNVSWYVIGTNEDGFEEYYEIDGMYDKELKKGKTLKIDTNAGIKCKGGKTIETNAGDVIRILITTGTTEVEAKVVVTK